MTPLPTNPPTPSPPPPTSTSANLPAALKWYYTHLFPLSLISRFLSPTPSQSTLQNREISFTLQGDIYLRWKSFPTPSKLHEALKQVTPVKIDIGAIYNYPPCEKNSLVAPLIPLEKELVFDIDMTDYGDVMSKSITALSAVQVCDQNWEYMATAVKVIDAALRSDFAFQNILWVYSGRRGIHCWVADKRAKRMSKEQRSAVADYLHLRFETKDNLGRRQNQVTTPLHPALARAKATCHSMFLQHVVSGKQRILESEQGVKDIVKCIPNRSVAEAIWGKVEPLLAGEAEGNQVWEKIEKEITKLAKTDYALRSTLDYVVLKYTYPRLDVNVSKEINHLLKAPFCVHPKTGRVCVPFRASEVDQFLPHVMAPEIGKLLSEIKEVEGGAAKSEGEATDRLKDAVAIFEQFVEQIEEEDRKERRLHNLDILDKKNAIEIMAN